jgi:hypothetical protein
MGDPPNQSLAKPIDISLGVFTPLRGVPRGLKLRRSEVCLDALEPLVLLFERLESVIPHGLFGHCDMECMGRDQRPVRQMGDTHSRCMKSVLSTHSVQLALALAVSADSADSADPTISADTAD